MLRPCRLRAPPVPIGRCVRPCSLCPCCCSRCRGIPARAARPISATMGRVNSVAARGSSIRKRKRRRQAPRRKPSTGRPLGVLRGFAIQQALVRALLRLLAQFESVLAKRIAADYGSDRRIWLCRRNRTGQRLLIQTGSQAVGREDARHGRRLERTRLRQRVSLAIAGGSGSRTEATGSFGWRRGLRQSSSRNEMLHAAPSLLRGGDHRG